MTTNRSAEELAMRDLVEAWGRARWPDARVVHELVINDCRIDMAFVGREHLAGVEIKSSKDTLDRLDVQMSTFMAALPEVWLAYAPRWVAALADWSVRRVPFGVGHLVVDAAAGELTSKIPHPTRPDAPAYPQPAKVNRSVTVPLIDLIWRAEAVAIGARTRIATVNSRTTLAEMKPTIARKLTGDEIVREVCRELRGRNAFWKADPPIIEARP